jgi:hypothetical protein
MAILLNRLMRLLIYSPGGTFRDAGLCRSNCLYLAFAMLHE